MCVSYIGVLCAHAVSAQKCMYASGAHQNVFTYNHVKWNLKITLWTHVYVLESASLCVCVFVQCTHSPINPTILDNMRPSRVKFGSPFLLPSRKTKGGKTEINNTPLSPQQERLFVYVHYMHVSRDACVCVCVCSHMHVMSLSLWFNMHNWSIHYRGRGLVFVRKLMVLT